MATIQYSDVIDRQLLPIDSQTLVTKVHLVIAGDRAGLMPAHFSAYEGSGDFGDQLGTEYAPAPIIHVYEAPEHATYGVAKSFALPSGVNPFLPPSDPGVPEPIQVTNMSNPGVPSAVRDGDPLTFAEFTGGFGQEGRIVYPPIQGAVGYRLRYEQVVDTPSTNLRGGVIMFINPVQPPAVSPAPPLNPAATYDTGWIYAASPGLLSQEHPDESYMIVPPLALWHPDNVPVTPQVGRPWLGSLMLHSWTDPDVFRVYAFYPLILNEPLLEDIARAQIRLPAQLPQRVTVRGYVTPDREHTITGWPGGDYTGVVAQHQYELGRTVIDFEQAGSPVGLPAEAMEAARERRSAIDDTVAVANYNLMMGSRR